MSAKQKLAVQMFLFAMVAIAANATLTEQKLKLMTFLILGLFAVKSWIGYRKDALAAGSESQEQK